MNNSDANGFEFAPFASPLPQIYVLTTLAVAIDPKKLKKAGRMPALQELLDQDLRNGHRSVGCVRR
jgi:hypothetical protein